MSTQLYLDFHQPARVEPVRDETYRRLQLIGRIALDLQKAASPRGVYIPQLLSDIAHKLASTGWKSPYDKDCKPWTEL
jgi:hypothetical protein